MSSALSGPGGRVALGTTILQIGRLPDNQLVIIDAKASSRHAEIRPDAKIYTLVDLGSTNGTFVNEQRLIPHTSRPLHSGDRIRIGDTIYTYEAVDSPDYAPTVYASPPSPANDATIAAPSRTPDPVTPYFIPTPEYPEYQALSPIYAPPPPPPQNPSSLPFSGQSVLPPQPLSVPQQAPAGTIPSPQKKSRKGLWITLGVISTVLVLACGGISTLVYLNLPTPEKTLTAFCTDVKNKNGAAAFDLFSASIKSHAPNNGQDFIAVIDKGQIVGCTHSAPVVTGENAQAQLTLTAIDNSSQANDVRLATDANGEWKISRLQAPSS